MTETRSPVVTVTLVILGILFLAPGACGTFFFGSVVIEMAGAPGGWGSDTAGYGLLFILVASASILLTLILLGVLMRAGGWPWARTVSLVIAVVAVVFVIGNHVVMQDLAQSQQNFLPIIFGFSIVGLGLSALPPFFHWRSGR